MTDQAETARAFAALHVPGDPLVLFNAWDAGSAKAIAAAGAKAIATGSWSVAAAQGYDDGEQIPLDQLTATLQRIVATVALPVSLDFEGGYAVDADGLTRNTAAVIAAGAVGVNFEDQIVGGEGLYAVADQAARVAAVRAAADAAGAPLYINARTDLFLKSKPADHDAALLDAALERARAYADAGASGFFAPFLGDEALIARLCEACPLPVNVMAAGHVPSTARLAELGVARVSYGPRPYRQAMAFLEDAAAEAFGK